MDKGDFGDAITVEQETCPECGESLQGTCEVIPGVAEMERDPSGRWSYTGYTKSFWDGQMTEMDDQGQTRVQCRKGHDWWTKVHY